MEKQTIFNVLVYFLNSIACISLKIYKLVSFTTRNNSIHWFLNEKNNKTCFETCLICVCYGRTIKPAILLLITALMIRWPNICIRNGLCTNRNHFEQFLRPIIHFILFKRACKIIINIQCQITGMMTFRFHQIGPQKLLYTVLQEEKNNMKI